MEPKQVQDPRKQQKLNRLQTFQLAPELAQVEETARLNELVEPLSKLSELFLGKSNGLFMEEIKRNLDREMNSVKVALSENFDSLQAAILENLDEEVGTEKREYLREFQRQVADLKTTFKNLKTSITPKAGREFPTFEELFDYIENAIPELRTIAVSAINILETLEGDARLDAKAVRNLEENIDVEKLKIEKYDDEQLRTQITELTERLQELADTPPRIIERTSGGALEFVEDASGNSFAGIKKIRFVGATVSKSNDKITITVTGGGGALAVETPTGTVNGTNASFTVSATPAYIVSDGITYFDGAGYSIVGTDVTMDIPPSQFIRAIR